MSILFTFLIGLCCTVGVYGTLGFDTVDILQTAKCKCLRQAGYSFQIQKAYTPFKGVNTNSIQALTNAKNAGLNTSILIEPCRGRTPANITGDISSKIPSNIYDTVWLQVAPINQGGCDWNQHTASTNCDYIADFASKIKAMKKNFGVFSSYVNWKAVFQNATYCNKLTQYPMWFIKLDDEASLTSFQPFGSWSHPTMKQFGLAETCGYGFKRSFHP